MKRIYPEKENYPDTELGVIEFVQEFFDPSINLKQPKIEPDPEIQGVWKVETDSYRAIVYLKGYKEPFGNIREYNDFEIQSFIL